MDWYSYFCITWAVITVCVATAMIVSIVRTPKKPKEPRK